MATTAVDISTLKQELKAWEKKFKLENGTDKITKEDIKANPEIDAKYKLWRELSKASGQKDQTVKQAPSTPPKASGSGTRPKANNASNIFQKAKAAPQQTVVSNSNPFSPTKGKGRANDDGDRLPAPSARAQGKKPAAEQNPFLVTSTPVKSSGTSRAGSSSGSRSTEPPNPFAASPTKKRASALFGSPSKASRKPSETSYDSPATSLHSSNPEVTRDSKYTYYSASPKKLQSLIHSTLTKDTPRTKSRKRLRGEEVSATPGDRRRKLARTSSPEELEGDDDEQMDLSPVKPSRTSSGKVFKPVFNDDDEEEEMPVFFSKPSGRSLSRSTSVRPGIFPSASGSTKKSNSGPDVSMVATPSTDDIDGAPRPLTPPPPEVKKKLEKEYTNAKLGNAKKNVKGKGKGKQPELAEPEATPKTSTVVEEDDSDGVKEAMTFEVDGTKGEPDGNVNEQRIRVGRIPLSDRYDRAADEEDETAIRKEDDGLQDAMLKLAVVGRSPEKQREQIAADVIAGAGRFTKARVRGEEVWGPGEYEEADEGEEDEWASDPDGWKGEAEL